MIQKLVSIKHGFIPTVTEIQESRIVQDLKRKMKMFLPSGKPRTFSKHALLMKTPVQKLLLQQTGKDRSRQRSETATGRFLRELRSLRLKRPFHRNSSLSGAMPASAAMVQKASALTIVTATPVRNIRRPGHVHKALMKNVTIAAAIPHSAVKIPARQMDAPLTTVHAFLQPDIAQTIPRLSAQQIMTVHAMLSA